MDFGAILLILGSLFILWAVADNFIGSDGGEFKKRPLKVSGKYLIAMLIVAVITIVVTGAI